MSNDLPLPVPADRLRLRSAHGEGLARKAPLARIEAEFLLIDRTAFSMTSPAVKSWAIAEGVAIAHDLRAVIERITRFNAAIEHLANAAPMAAPRGAETQSEAAASARLTDFCLQRRAQFVALQGGRAS